MPKSKRNKTVSLTKVKKSGRKGKESLVETVHEALEKYDSVYVFSFSNMRTAALKELRMQLKDDRFIMGKQNVMALALGRTPEEEPKENLHMLSQHLSGGSGLFLTGKPKGEVMGIFNGLHKDDYATSGSAAKQDVHLQAGPLNFQHTMVDPLRKLGLPVMLKNGVVTLEKDFVVCKAGVTLTPEQAKILKLFEAKLGDFKPTLKAVWIDGNYEELE